MAGRGRRRTIAPWQELIATTVAALPDAPKVRWARVDARTGWTDTGILLRAGQSVTITAYGALSASRLLDVALLAPAALWIKIGDDPIRSVTGSRLDLTAGSSGPLQLLAAEPGLLCDTDGTLDRSVRPMRLRGGFDVAVLIWPNRPDATAKADDSGAPRGWAFHPRLPRAAIFTERTVGEGSEIICRTHADVAIVRHPVDLALSADLELAWSWNIEQLPSALPEHTSATHDYLSIAVEFDDGRDLTWMWSHSLPPGYVFACPLRWWRDRETHLVVRTGTAALNSWQHERRNVLADLRHARLQPAPGRVVAVWLIANSTLARSTGIATYRDIRLITAQKTVPVTTPTGAESTDPPPSREVQNPLLAGQSKEGTS